jgi:hypothetical protein
MSRNRAEEKEIMPTLNELREQGQMTWIDAEHGWGAVAEDIVAALSTDGFQECKRETTTSRRDLRPAGGLWQGVNTRTGSVASAIWVIRPAQARTVVFITIDGESFGHPPLNRPADDPYRDDGGES